MLTVQPNRLDNIRVVVRVGVRVVIKVETKERQNLVGY